MAQAETILIAVQDGVLADSLRFSLELEGFDTRFCDEHSLCPLMSASCLRGACLVLDQDVFSRVVDGGGPEFFADQGMPVILMVSQKTERILAHAKVGGVTTVLESPILGDVLFDTIRQEIERKEYSSRGTRPS